jgi:hypothetical protein
VHAIGRETGDQGPEQRDKSDDESQPNHWLSGDKGVEQRSIKHLTYARAATN